MLLQLWPFVITRTSVHHWQHNISWRENVERRINLRIAWGERAQILVHSVRPPGAKWQPELPIPGSPSYPWAIERYALDPQPRRLLWPPWLLVLHLRLRPTFVVVVKPIYFPFQRPLATKHLKHPMVMDTNNRNVCGHNPMPIRITSIPKNFNPKNNNQNSESKSSKRSTDCLIAASQYAHAF